jgi:hypothetical protein
MTLCEKRFLGLLRGCIVCVLLVLLSGCAVRKTVSFKINSVPKGAYVLYQVLGEGLPCDGKWIYLGNTPVQGVQQFDEDRLGNADKITLKIMHRGYYDQTKEWDGPGFWREVTERDVIFWTPKMVPSPQGQ